MDQLNDKLLIKIFDHLDFKDCLSIAKVKANFAKLINNYFRLLICNWIMLMNVLWNISCMFHSWLIIMASKELQHICYFICS